MVLQISALVLLIGTTVRTEVAFGCINGQRMNLEATVEAAKVELLLSILIFS